MRAAGQCPAARPAGWVEFTEDGRAEGVGVAADATLQERTGEPADAYRVNWTIQVPQLARRVPGGGGNSRSVVYSFAAQNEPSVGSMARPL